MQLPPASLLTLQATAEAAPQALEGGQCRLTQPLVIEWRLLRLQAHHLAAAVAAPLYQLFQAAHHPAEAAAAAAAPEAMLGHPAPGVRVGLTVQLTGDGTWR